MIRPQDIERIVAEWQRGELAREVRSRMDGFAGVLGRDRQGRTVLKYRRRPPGLSKIRIYSGRLYGSLTGAQIGAAVPAQGDMIRKVKVGDRYIEITIGSLLPYAARHELRPRTWQPFFVPSVEAAVDTLVSRIQQHVERTLSS